MIRKRFDKLAIFKTLSKCVPLMLALLFASCSEFEQPRTEPFYSQTAPPQKREFRWSNGKMPKSFDPAYASAPPETDIIRAVFDGLTEADPKSLEPMPSIASKWEASEDFKTWTFHLRKDAEWSNGERITAKDFVRSWKRIAELGKAIPERRLFDNIVGMKLPEIPGTDSQELDNELISPVAELPTSGFSKNTNSKTEPERAGDPTPTAEKKSKEREIGVVAVDPQRLVVSLVRSDRDFPALVSLPVFRPIYGDGKDVEPGKLNTGVVTSGSFRISSVGPEGVTLDRSENHPDRDRVELDRVRFVPMETAEKALEAYRLGEIDAVTNAHFEPLALKLLKPFDDFRQTTHGALNFYEFNREKPPFSDRRVREALTISIDRDRITAGEMEGSTRSALSYIPFGAGETEKFEESTERAKKLLEEAGFPNGTEFPTLRLVVNRNDVQQRIARLVAKMWEQELNVRTEIVVVESAEIERIRGIREFDLIRRGVVLPSSDELASLLAIFAPPKKPEAVIDPNASPSPVPSASPTVPAASPEAVENAEGEESELVLRHLDAIENIPAIPLYFPTSYSLIKPYVLGFELNVLDAPSLRDVRIDTGWQPKTPKKES